SSWRWRAPMRCGRSRPGRANGSAGSRHGTTSVPVVAAALADARFDLGFLSLRDDFFSPARLLERAAAVGRARRRETGAADEDPNRPLDVAVEEARQERG